MNSNWPPPYNVRVSQKAKRISLKICHTKGLEIIVPKNNFLKFFDADKILNEHKPWIFKHLDTIIHYSKPQQLPEAFNLQAIDEEWHIKYLLDLNRNSISSLDSLKIIIVKYKYIKSTLEIKRLLKKWLLIKAKNHLAIVIENLSKKFNLEFNTLRIRGQKTLWGSCDKHKNISLNYKLMFLPSSVVEYVILHELAHTKYLNHGKNFWSLVQKIDPDCALHRKMLKAADVYVPSLINA